MEINVPLPSGRTINVDIEDVESFEPNPDGTWLLKGRGCPWNLVLPAGGPVDRLKLIHQIVELVRESRTP